MMLLRISLSFLLALFATGVDAKCERNKGCLSCVEDRTLLFMPCHWCALEGACYAPWSLRNHCPLDFNIQDLLQCGRYERHTKLSDYDPEEAYKLALFSALAYSNTPDLCLQEVFPDSDYRVISINIQSCGFLFDHDAKCIAFVTVSIQKGEIIVAYRGTHKSMQILDQALTTIATAAVSSTIGGRVQRYFQNVHEKLFPDVYDSVMEMTRLYPDFIVKFTGHSLGGAVASIASAHMVKEKLSIKENVVLYTFGMPRVGDKQYALIHDYLVPNSWRVVRDGDIVASIPNCKIYICTPFNKPFHHQNKVLYSGQKMNVDSEYIICNGKEGFSKQCGEPTNHWHHILFGSLDVHRTYFNIHFGTYCMDQVNKNESIVY